MRKLLASLVGAFAVGAALLAPAAGGAGAGLVTCTVTSGTSVTTIQVPRPLAQQLNGLTVTLDGVTVTVTCAI
jgi:hypothetical protein